MKEYKKRLKTMFVQVAILSVWYLAMLAVFKFPFIKNQFLEAMVKRVTASIESHFGQRTYYLTTLYEQLKLLMILGIVGFLLLLKDTVVKKDWRKLILALFFVPWFLFLNLTKTKIAWYIYPVIPQFAFLAVYFFSFLKKHKRATTAIAVLIAIVIFNRAFRQDKFFGTFYSAYDQYYKLAVYAGKNCKELELLVDPDTRQTYDILNSMDLTISTTKWWGSHPSIVYYSGKKVNFVYDVESFTRDLPTFGKKQCVVVSSRDVDLVTTKRDYVLRNNFKEMYLFTKAL